MFTGKITSTPPIKIVEDQFYCSRAIYPYVLYSAKKPYVIGVTGYTQERLRHHFGCIPQIIRVTVEMVEPFNEEGD